MDDIIKLWRKTSSFRHVLLTILTDWMNGYGDELDIHPLMIQINNETCIQIKRTEYGLGVKTTNYFYGIRWISDDDLLKIVQHYYKYLTSHV